MGMTIDNRFKYFKDINESLKRKYGTTDDFPYSQMASAVDNIPVGAEIEDVEINAEGHLIVTFSDGTTMDAGYIGIPTISIATATVTLSDNSYVYDGTSKLPAVETVVLDGTVLVEKQDYVIISNTEINAGNYLILIQGIGNYSGVASANWKITKSQSTINGDDSITISVVDESVSKTYTTNGDGEFSFEITGNVATITNTGGVVTITPTAYGTADLTVTVSEGQNYLGATKSVTITVEKLQTATVFGVMWEYSLASPALVRLTPQTDPLGVVTNVPTQEPTSCVGNDGNGQSDFDNYMPWKGMNRYNYVNGQIIDFVGYSNGETFVYIPEFWSKIVNDTTNSKMYIYISSEELEGFTKHLGSGRYIARYPCDNNFLSRPNGLPKVNTSLSGFRTGITAIDNKHFQFDIHTYMARNLLYLIEFAHYNSQAKIGEGITTGTSAHVSGETDILIYHTGRVGGTNNQSAVQYRWIENPWGNVWNWVDGALIQDGLVYLCNEATRYSNTITENYISTELTTPTISGWQKTEQDYNDCYLIPLTTGSSNSTYTCDYYYYNTGLRGLVVGGNYGDGSYSGLFFLAGSEAPGSANAYIGGRSILILGGEF